MHTTTGPTSDVTYYDSFQELAAATAPEKRRARLRPATDFPAEEVDWLWPGKIPIGKVTLLVGDPGCGKSLVAIDAAARVTRGMSFPVNAGQGDTETWRQGDSPNSPPSDSLSPCLPLSLSDSSSLSSLPTDEDSNPMKPTPGSVLILSADDQIADTIRPRLDAAGADPAKVFFASEVTDLRRDLGLLAEMLADAPDCRLIIVDPVTAYVGPSDSHFHTIVRKVLAPLAELAAKRKIAILAVTHLRKNSGAAITRATGSMGFAAASRCVWTVTPDEQNPGRNLLLPVKNNLGPKEPGLAFSIERSAGARAPNIHWHDVPVETPTETTPVSKRGPEAEDRQNAARWLELALADGPRDSYLVLNEGKQNGFTSRTLQRALHLVGGITRKKSFNGGWLWSLTPTCTDQEASVAGLEPKASPQPLAPSPQSPKKPGVFDETCRLRENPDDSPTANLSPSRFPPTICDPPPISVAESIRFLNNLDKHRERPPDPVDEDPNSPTGHPILDQLLDNFRNGESPHNTQRSTLNSQPAHKKSARSHSRLPTGTDSWHFTRPAGYSQPGAMHLGDVSAQALDESSTRRREDAV